MINRRITGFVLLAVLLALTACVSEAPQPPVDTASPPEVVGVVASEPETYAGERADFTFLGLTAAEYERTVAGVEAVIAIAKEQYGLNSGRPKVTLTADDVPPSVATGILAFNPDDVRSVGALFFHAGSKNLPRWLSAGLELYWLDKQAPSRFAFDRDVDGATLPALNDTWFLDGSPIDATSREALSVLYAFVTYLDETDALTDLVGLYANKKTVWEAEQLRAEAWAAFTGQTEPVKASYRADYAGRMTVYTKQGTYSYSDEDGWTYDMIQDYTALMDVGIHYTKDWFDYEDDAPIPVRLYGRVGESLHGYAAIDGNISIYNNFAVGPYIVVHEAVHVLIGKLKIVGPYPFFEEGLAHAIMYQGASENEMIRQSIIQEFEALAVSTEALWGAAFEELYEARTGRPYRVNGRLDEDQLDIQAVLDIQAIGVYAWLDIHDSYGFLVHPLSGINPTDSPHERRNGFLLTHQTGGSFFGFLLNKGSQEDCMRFYNNPNAAEMLYGKDLDGLIAEWRDEYLQVSKWMDSNYVRGFLSWAESMG